MRDTERDTTCGRQNLAMASPDPAIPQPGTCIDTYEVRRVLGVGGMGLVLEARDTSLERQVALKLVHPELLNLPGIESSFLEEARAMAALTHPNVVSIHAFGHYRGCPYFAMELVEGENLWRRLYETRTELTIDERLSILESIARGLDAIHASGRIHGDVKAENVLLETRGRVLLSDMGLSETLGRLRNSYLRGTPAYMPPERAAGLRLDDSLRTRQDIYSFAVLAFELLTGRLPFDLEKGDPVEKLIQMHMQHPPPRPSEVSGLPETFDRPLLRSLDKAPSARHEKASALVAALRTAWAATSHGIRILLADDDADFLSVLSEGLALRYPGADIDCVGDGSSALARARTHPPDVAIVDLDMPGQNGIELTASLRAVDSTGDVGIIVLTGSGGAHDWRVLHELGANQFFVKPTDLDMVCSAIDQLSRPMS